MCVIKSAGSTVCVVKLGDSGVRGMKISGLCGVSGKELMNAEVFVECNKMSGNLVIKLMNSE